jgi:formylglycine-generating enzyme required for sulfatase activity
MVTADGEPYMKRPGAILSLLLAAWSWPVAADDAPVRSGSVFRDCPDCPQMVVIPPGSFMMGDADRGRERPVHQVRIGYYFAVGKFDVTFDDWAACVQGQGCSGVPNDNGWGRGNRPLIDVSWDQAQHYVAWLRTRTGKSYRLLSEAEWEYVARAGTTTRFWWGEEVGENNAACDGCKSGWDNKETAPSGDFKPNPFGLYDTAGEVSVWVQDPWHDNYEGAPTDGRVWEPGDPKRRVMRNGSWFNSPQFMYPAFRNGDAPIVHNSKLGFRVARGVGSPPRPRP